MMHLTGDVATQRKTERPNDKPKPVAIAAADLLHHIVDLSMREHERAPSADNTPYPLL
jgi:hypothetical protein